MHSVRLTDWITIRGSGTTPVVQSEEDWLKAPEYADAIFWVEVTEVTNPGSGTVALRFETAPAPFESLFVTLDSVDVLTVGPAPVLRKAFMNQVVKVPLARLLRWKLVGSAAGTWDVTFRVHVTFGEGVRSAMSPRSALDSTGAGTQPGLLLWLRADQGVVLSGSNVTDWLDQSGNGNHVTQAVAGSRPVLVNNAIGGRPALDFSGSKFMQSTLTSLVAGGTAYSVLCVAKNGNGTLLSLRLASPPATTYSASMFFLANTYVYSDSSVVNETVGNTLAETQSASAAFKSCHRYEGAGQFAKITLNTTPRTITGGFAQTTETGATGFQVGVNTQTVPEYWNGLIAEVIVVRGAISDLDRQRIELYQRNFFGV